MKFAALLTVLICFDMARASSSVVRTAISRASSQKFDSNQFSIAGAFGQTNKIYLMNFEHNSRLFESRSVEDRVIGLGLLQNISDRNSLVFLFMRNQDSNFLFDQSVNVEWYHKSLNFSTLASYDLRAFSNINSYVSSFLVQAQWRLPKSLYLLNGFRGTFSDKSLYSFEVGAGTFSGPFELNLLFGAGQELLDRALYNSFRNMRATLRTEYQATLFEIALEEMYGSLRNESRATLSVRFGL